MSPRLGTEENGSWEMPIGADTESPNQSLFSSQRTGEGQSSKIDNFSTTIAVL